MRKDYQEGYLTYSELNLFLLVFPQIQRWHPGTEPVPPRLEGDVQSPELPNYGIEWVVLILRVSRARVCWVFVIFLFSCKFWGCTSNRLRPLASASSLFHIRKEMSPSTQLRSCCQDSVSHRSWMNEWVDDSSVSHLCYSYAWTT
jgi:hypothetical protein